MSKFIILIVSVFMVTGCATRGSTYVPIVDLKGKDVFTFNRNVAECQVYAKKRMDAASGAAFGAVAGALLSAALGGSRASQRRGAVVGATYGAKGTNDTQETIIKRCLRGRGYNVLD